MTPEATRWLYDAGIANFNLIRMSSVIPPGSVVREVPGMPGLGQGLPQRRFPRA